MTEGRLVSILGFGFWVSLCKRPYEQGRTGGPRLWPELATKGFPHLPNAKRTRSQIYHALDPLRDLRNRVSHHEAVWDRKLNRSHQEVLDIIAWINSDLAATLKAHSPLPGGIRQGRSRFPRSGRGNHQVMSVLVTPMPSGSNTCSRT